MGSMVMGEHEKWPRKSYIAQKTCKHSKEKYGQYLHMPWIFVKNMQVWKNQFQNISWQK